MVRGRRRRWPWVLMFSLIGVVFVVHALGGWYLADRFHSDVLLVEPAAAQAVATGTIQSLEGKTVVIAEDAVFAEERQYDQAVMGLSTASATLVLGPVLSSSGQTLTRPVLAVIGDKPKAGDAYGLHRDVWLTPAQAGLKDTDVVVTALGGQTYPAWRMAADSRNWAILVHDKGQARSEMLRLARPLLAEKLNVLVVSYTGDLGAPASSDGMLHYGRSEWADLEAAVQYAVDQDAEEIVLGGSGHGGAVVLGFMARGSLASRVSGIILDGPASSVGDLLAASSEIRRSPVLGLPIPESVAEVSEWLVAFQYGVDFSSVDYSGMYDLIRLPLLTFQGEADRDVPKSVNDRFMTTGSGATGQYRVVAGADHGLTWNVNPEGYDAEVKQFVTGLEDQEDG